ncbi:MAG: hypothetical protein QM756_47595 [Polyangiaceae bacterium]
MLSGTAPFQHESDVMLMVMHVRDQVPPLLERVPGLSPALAQVVEACLAEESQGSAEQRA